MTIKVAAIPVCGFYCLFWELIIMIRNYNSFLIKKWEEKPILFNRGLAKALGNIKAGLFLSQLLYWFNEKGESKGKNKNWVYKTIKEFKEEIGFTRTEQENACKILIKFDLITIKYKSVPRKRYFSINKENINKLLSYHYSVGRFPAN